MRSRHGSRFARLALRSALLAALLLPAAASLAADRVSDGDRQFLRRELRLNTFTASAQERVALASQADGDLLAVWESHRQLDGRYGVFARRVDAWGRADGAELAVNLDRSAQYQQPTVAGAPGKLWMVWTAWGQDGSAHAVVGRVEGGDELLLNQTTAGSQESPVALTLVDGRHLAVWTGPGEEPGTSAIFGRLVSASAQPLSGRITGVSSSPSRTCTDFASSASRAAWCPNHSPFPTAGKCSGWYASSKLIASRSGRSARKRASRSG